MSLQLSLNGHTVEEILAATRAVATVFGWKAENQEPYEMESSFAKSPSVVVAAYNLQHSEGFQRVVVSLQGDGDERRLDLATNATEQRNPSVVDDEWQAHYKELGHALSVVTL